jgi:hypothetical protein
MIPLGENCIVSEFVKIYVKSEALRIVGFVVGLIPSLMTG